MPASIKEQIRRNLVAIISLVLAILSLSYNTWRMERFGYPRPNVRFLQGYIEDLRVAGVPDESVDELPLLYRSMP
jgi:hypothetical protein